ncbi:MAG TPA: ATP-binding protein [Candidatus Limnocylindria bacterium]
MKVCHCDQQHHTQRVVLTGGPGAGKTAVLELVRWSFCEHVRVLPEAAGIVYGGGFPRSDDEEARRASQRAIFHVQRELESVGAIGRPPVVICDRGTVDGGAYWPGPRDLWSEVGTTLADELARYDTVIHLRTPKPGSGYDQRNPLRIESALEARVIDDRIAQLWQGHPHIYSIEARADFLAKAVEAVKILREQVASCCRPRELVLA